MASAPTWTAMSGAPWEAETERIWRALLHAERRPDRQDSHPGDLRESVLRRQEEESALMCGSTSIYAVYVEDVGAQAP